MKNESNFLKYAIPRAFRSTLCAAMILGTGAMYSCSDDDDDLWANAEFPEEVNAQKLDMWNYSVPFDVKSNGEWEIETEGKFFDVVPRKGNGNSKVTLYLVYNHEDDRRQGKMIIKSADGTSETIELQQKCEADYGENAVVSDTYREQGVGYGYNAFKGVIANPDAISLNPILRVEELDNYNALKITENSSSIETRISTGRTFEELVNNFSANASLDASPWKFSTEVNSHFNSNHLNSKVHEYAITEIFADKGTLSISKFLDNQGIKDVPTEMLWGSVREAINGTYNEYRGKSGAINLIKDYGTHLIMAARVGGKLNFSTAVNTSTVSGFYDLEAFAAASYNGINVNGQTSVTDDFKNSFANNSVNVSVRATAYGGSHEEFNQAFIQGKPENTAEIYAKWHESLSSGTGHNGINNTPYNLACLEPVDRGLIPIQNLVTLKEGRDARIREIEDAIKAIKNGEIVDKELVYNVSYENGKPIQFTIPTFDDTDPNATLVKKVSTVDAISALICHEYIPSINESKKVTVVYPIINNNVKLNMGYFIGDEGHSPASVSWTDGELKITELKERPMGENTKVYVKGSFVGDSCMSKKFAPVNIDDFYLEAPKMDPIIISENEYNIDPQRNGKYPVVKIFNNIWTREDYKGGTLSDASSISWLLANKNFYWCKKDTNDPLPNIHDGAPQMTIGGVFYENDKYDDKTREKWVLYDQDLVAKDNFAPSRWEVADSADFAQMFGILEKTELGGNQINGRSFFCASPEQTSMTGFEAPCTGYLEATNPLNNFPLDCYNKIYLFNIPDPNTSYYFTADNNMVRFNKNGWSVFGVKEGYYNNFTTAIDTYYTAPYKRFRNAVRLVMKLNP